MSGRFGPYRHIFRMAGLFVVGIGLFLVARAVFVPKDFGRFGHYRPAALGDNAARPVSFAGRAACEPCHDDIVGKRQGSRHQKIGCEACHGPSARHAVSSDGEPKPVRPDPRGLCLGCHTRDAARPATFPQIVPAEHAPEGPCTACHDAHKPGLS